MEHRHDDDDDDDDDDGDDDDVLAHWRRSNANEFAIALSHKEYLVRAGKRNRQYVLVFRREMRFAIRNKYKIKVQELWTKYEKANTRKCQQNTKTKLKELWTSTRRSRHRVVVVADVRRGGDGADGRERFEAEGNFQ